MTETTTKAQAQSYNLVGTVSDVKTGAMKAKDGNWLHAKLTSEKDGKAKTTQSAFDLGIGEVTVKPHRCSAWRRSGSEI